MKGNKLITTIYAAALTLAVGITGTAHAVPGLQIDAEGGTYYGDPSPGDVDTTICSTSTCDFYAILTPPNSATQAEIDALLATEYYVSIALKAPDGGTVTTGGSYGTFDVTINGVTTTVTVTDDMTFGVPPLETVMGLSGSDPGDLATHSIFPTYYSQVAIDFVAGDTIAEYNVQDDAGTPASKVGPGDSFYDIVTIDRTNLAEGYQLHLDLYNQEVKDCGQPELNLADPCLEDIDVDDFAPFSKDAETGTSSGQASTTSSGQASTTSSGQSSTGTGVPEPSTLALLGFGILSGLLFNRKRKIKA